ncbi:hypothetical protein HWD35_22575 [Tsukamurella tyrosinosolvens]|uniref:TNase-like domain-containing protein n=1 Tax=Tsukamurella tyrosinosolvens TaxID=57704 RepID=A0A1H4ICS8_TSUTY|nr:hypothetical protein [Tsukamurella tyrosinosolvens]KXO98110.1 hypothetical protein AXK58_25820 [Tsukamurella tyrosinosolvens]KXP01963.1 hypothetical protein AXK59_21030 [Tsukamurella tyrosinosolvens]KZL95167.1 hypothetical protein AXX05_11215 [Tsukamurella tyrosinosolvens]MCA4997509.1 hypothetical protein [Tsukamurella tyrosinosolvens]QRY85357.1 hypothetical protein JVY00_04510 [Tsukamurella tyrosinosolvens]
MRKTIRAAAAATLLATSLTAAAGAANAAPAPKPANTVVVDVRTHVFLTSEAPPRTTVYADGRIVTKAVAPGSRLVELRGKPTDVADLRAMTERVLRNPPNYDRKAQIFDGWIVSATVRTTDGALLKATVDNPEPRGWSALSKLPSELDKRIAAIPGPRTPYTAPR